MSTGVFDSTDGSESTGSSVPDDLTTPSVRLSTQVRSVTGTDVLLCGKHQSSRV